MKIIARVIMKIKNVIFKRFHSGKLHSALKKLAVKKSYKNKSIKEINTIQGKKINN
jgi:hypothetical protein